LSRVVTVIRNKVKVIEHQIMQRLLKGEIKALLIA
jgi:hypothetical protein